MGPQQRPPDAVRARLRRTAQALRDCGGEVTSTVRATGPERAGPLWGGDGVPSQSSTEPFPGTYKLAAMSKLFRCLVMSRDTAQPQNVCTNTLYFKNNSPTADEPEGLASDVLAIYVARSEFTCGANELEVRFYDMEDPEPRPILDQAKQTITKVAPGAREVALCLSFYANRNIPRRRGRLYLGPVAPATERPSDGFLNAALAMGDAFAALGGIDIDWGVFSPTDWREHPTNDAEDFFYPVTDCWCDDEWDTVRSRGRKATKRLTRQTGA